MQEEDEDDEEAEEAEEEEEGEERSRSLVNATKKPKFGCYEEAEVVSGSSYSGSGSGKKSAAEPAEPAQ